MDAKRAVKPGAEHIRSVFERYAALLCAGDPAGIAALFAPNAVLEDPVGAAPHVGLQAIRDFFQAGFDATGGGINFEAEGEIRICGEYAACAFVATCEKVAEPFEVRTIDFARFDSQGRIVSWIAVWGPENTRRLER